ncbi:hypothetical protein MtrunA17_Chr5g0430991 [Medicago truncatula]|uniref:Uncharacterized protein n=1 Tax=Medicago truncatula TaxID=3880 RepID=A0A396HTB0_MEDTR|nr:hypothetical protein MtrunA17_Chr5g0430991 [Medicago truncatula]
MNLSILSVLLLSFQQKKSPSNKLRPKIYDGKRASQYAYPRPNQTVRPLFSILVQNHLHILNDIPYETHV